MEPGNHAKISLYRNHILKEFKVQKPLSVSEMANAYNNCRNNVSAYYKVPELFESSIEQETNTLRTKEEYIDGLNITTYLSQSSIRGFHSIFSQLFEPLLLQPYLKCPLITYNLAPGNLIYDFRPANFVIRDDSLFAIDFYPPYTRNAINGLLVPFDNSLDRGKHEYVTYLFGDRIPMVTKFFFELSKQNIQVARGLSLLVGELISTQPKLQELMLINASYQKVDQAFNQLPGGNEVLLNIVGKNQCKT